MDIHWNDKEPMYRQLLEHVEALIGEGFFAEGEALPSVRQIAAENRINPLTVSKSYQLLVDDDVVEKKRGLGMFVMKGAREKLQLEQRRRFLSEEWPRIQTKMARLGLTMMDLSKEEP